MGRKSSSKNQPATGAAPGGTPSGGFSPLFIGAILVGVVSIAVFAFWGGSDAPTTQAQTPASPAPVTAGTPSAPPTLAVAAEAPPESVAAARAAAALGPRKQANLPPIPYQGYAPPRPVEVVNAAYQFVAEHPEVSSYIPCFCGCQNSGHRGNADCFVHSRAANGDVIEWDGHGVECAVCIDVATRSRQMLAAGASVRDIRAAVEKEFAPNFTTMTPTPKAPADSHDH